MSKQERNTRNIKVEYFQNAVDGSEEVVANVVQVDSTGGVVSFLGCGRGDSKDKALRGAIKFAYDEGRIGKNDHLDWGESTDYGRVNLTVGFRILMQGRVVPDEVGREVISVMTRPTRNFK